MIISACAHEKSCGLRIEKGKELSLFDEVETNSIEMYNSLFLSFPLLFSSLF